MQLSALLWEIILPFLGPRELLIVASTCRYFKNSLTYPLVIKHILQNHKIPTSTGKSLEHMMNLLSLHRIYKPTPIRLLRVCVGRKCECGNFCMGINGYGNRDLVECVQEEFGLFVCRSCALGLTTIVPGGDKDDALETMLLNQGRVCRYKATSANFFKEMFVAKDGEVCGPVVTFDEVLKKYDEGGDVEGYLKGDEGSSEECEGVKELIKLYEKLKGERRDDDGRRSWLRD
ncbi:hypothetical protein HDU76_000109 [Blyttiomyces sp. JEL0837]|nr:hypothetical protein HDU76_000109 [Blyttiomyces sp. JEL0837]